MRRAATALLVLLVVVAAGGAVLDRVVVARTEERLLEEAGRWAELAPGAEVEIDGFPFLTQVLAGRLAEVRGTAPALVVDGMELTDVRVVARGVRPADPYPAETVAINAGVPVETLESAVVSAADLPGDPLSLAAGEGVLQLGVELAGLELSALLEPRIVDDAIGLQLGEVQVGGAGVPDEIVDLAAELLSDVRLDIPGLPEGLVPTRIAVDADGLRVRLEGTDVELGVWAV